MNSVLSSIVNAQTKGEVVINSLYATEEMVMLQFVLFNQSVPSAMGQRSFPSHVVFEDTTDLIEELWASDNLLILSDT